MILLSGAQSTLASHLLPMIRDTHQVCAFGPDRGSVRDPQFLSAIFAEMRPSVFINCHEFQDMEQCECFREDAYENNATAAGSIAALCAERGVMMVQLSTSYIFDGRKREPYIETDEPRPLQAYGDSKLLAEKLVRGSGCRCLIVRVPDVYGAGSSLLSDLISKLKIAGDVPVVGDMTVCPSYAGDISRGVIALIEKGAQGVFHLSNEGSTSWAGFAAAAADTCRRHGAGDLPGTIVSVSLEDYPSMVDRPAYSLLNTDAFAAAAGFRLRSWEEALEECVARHFSAS